MVEIQISSVTLHDRSLDPCREEEIYHDSKWMAMTGEAQFLDSLLIVQLPALSKAHPSATASEQPYCSHLGRYSTPHLLRVVPLAQSYNLSVDCELPAASLQWIVRYGCQTGAIIDCESA